MSTGTMRGFRDLHAGDSKNQDLVNLVVDNGDTVLDMYQAQEIVYGRVDVKDILEQVHQVAVPQAAAAGGAAVPQAAAAGGAAVPQAAAQGVAVPQAAAQGVAVPQAAAGGVAEVQAELTRFTRLLMQTTEAASCIDVTSEGDYFQLPYSLTQPVYKRACYQRIWDQLMAPDIVHRKRHGLVLTGTPGIGKSVFAVYAIWRLSQAKQVVFYQCTKPGGIRQTYRWDFRKSQHVTAQIVKDVEAAEDFCGPDTWLLIDESAGKAQYQGQQHVVVLTSPNAENFYHFQKGRDTLVRVVPVWDEEELEQLRALLYDGTVTQEQRAARFRMFGGVPRLVLVQLEVDPAKLIAQEITPKAVSKLHMVLGSRLFRDDFSHTLGHYHVDSNFRLRGIRPASPAVLQAVFGVQIDKLQQTLQEFVNGAEAPPSLAAVCGHMFEAYGHRMLGVGVTSCNMCPLVPRTADEGQPVPCRRSQCSATAQGAAAVVPATLSSPVQVQMEGCCMDATAPQQAAADAFAEDSHHFLSNMSAEQHLAAVEEHLTEVETMQQSEGQQVLQQLTLQDQYELPSLAHVWDAPQLDLRGLRGVYWQPSSSVNAAIDAAISWPNGDCDLLQYTVGRRYGIKHDATYNFLQRIDRGHNRVRLMFVVPPDLDDNFSWQPWLNVDGSVRLQPIKILATLPQYKVQLPISYSPRGTQRGTIEQQQSRPMAV